MFEGIINFFKKIGKQNKEQVKSKDAAKERLHLVLMQDRANVSADFLDLMKQEIIEVIKKYIDVDENAIDVRLTNKSNGDGTTGAPALYANIPIVSIKEEVKNGMATEKNTQKNEEIPQKETIQDQEYQTETMPKDNENTELVDKIEQEGKSEIIQEEAKEKEKVDEQKEVTKGKIQEQENLENKEHQTEETANK